MVAAVVAVDRSANRSVNIITGTVTFISLVSFGKFARLPALWIGFHPQCYEVTKLVTKAMSYNASLIAA